MILPPYFKQEAISWSYEFLTSKEEGLGLDVNRLYFTIFEGDENAPYDQESKEIWMSKGIPENRIYALPAEDNWWSPGDNGPCGPCSEMFYDMSGNVGDLSHEEFLAAIKKESVIEIWNDVFMEYEKNDGKVIGKLAQKNVDTGAGLERITAVMQGKQTAYDTDIFEEVIQKIKEQAQIKDDEKSIRIVADHIRTSVFLIADGVVPSSSAQGYILRRLLRRSIRIGHSITLNFDYKSFVDVIESKYSDVYPNIKENKEKIISELEKEFNKFIKTLSAGLKEIEKGKVDAFDLFTTYGFPVELTIEESKKRNFSVDMEKYNSDMAEHQKLSQTASAGMFKGGLANHNEKTIQLHTAHHLLLAALQEVLGKEVKQKGSNITEERLRMDFAFDRKMTDDEKTKVQEIVNNYISRKLNVVRREMPRAEAEAIGAEMEFGAKYPDTVSVYFIEDENGNPVSKEFCGGPHVSNTSELGSFKIQKEEASSQGVRRIKAVLN